MYYSNLIRMRTSYQMLKEEKRKETHTRPSQPVAYNKKLQIDWASALRKR